ncbi:MAG: P27 family phage terminase small subunit [Sulfurimonas sp.]
MPDNVTDNNNCNWEDIKWEFENTKCTLGDLEEKYGVYKMKISRKSRKEGWVKYSPPADNVQTKAVTVINPSGILNDIGVRKIQEIVKELGDAYSPVDEPLVVSYAESYQRYLKLVAIVDAEGEVSMSPKTGATYMNPNFSALQGVKTAMAKLGDKLGLSISSRRRMKLSLKKEDKSKSLFNLVNEISEGDFEI